MLAYELGQDRGLGRFVELYDGSEGYFSRTDDRINPGGYHPSTWYTNFIPNVKQRSQRRLRSMALERVAVTWDHERLKRDRLAMLQAEMQRQAIGALYLTEGSHVRYLLDAQVPVGRVFVPVEGEPMAYVRGRDIGYMQLAHGAAQQADLPPTEVRDSDGRKDLAGELRDLMARHGVAGQRLGIDMLRPDLLLELFQSGLPIVAAEVTCERANSVKTQDELAMYRAIGKQYVQTLEHSATRSSRD